MKAASNIILLAVAFATIVTAASMVKFVNNCPYNTWFWTVGPAGSNIFGNDHERIMVPGSGGSVIHSMINTEALSGGLVLKIRDLPRYQVGQVGILQVEYHLEPSTKSFWYDFSTIDCLPGAGPENPRHCPVIEGGIKMHVPGQAIENACPPAWCANGTCHNTYQKHGSWLGEPTLRCSMNYDLVIEMCTENPGHQTHDDAAPKPKPVLVASPNGSCGTGTGYTCMGSRFGESCSKYGYCGNGEPYRGMGCQPEFATCAKSMFGSCCSQHNYCGDTDEFCGQGCQSAFGNCGLGNSNLRSTSR
ncbi:hypothetical protein BDU57DRAFT_562254 [Ampelomyces quisqualis]|uniref:Chitin-binding type-1 domain-containing protein n=1 Tax=Ampelomyces quisqualis TaxID=50730 RepID=A0A6A5R258_AMPQU|nr:hypothetical protein BDU57DRAFT_562254 [Ampelomyces quisqualis]